jgi:hypothetical protein
VLFSDSLGNKLLVGAAMMLGSGIGTMKFIVKKSVS